MLLTRLNELTVVSTLSNWRINYVRSNWNPPGTSIHKPCIAAERKYLIQQPLVLNDLCKCTILAYYCFVVCSFMFLFTHVWCVILIKVWVWVYCEWGRGEAIAIASCRCRSTTGPRQSTHIALHLTRRLPPAHMASLLQLLTATQQTHRMCSRYFGQAASVYNIWRPYNAYLSANFTAQVSSTHWQA